MQYQEHKGRAVMVSQGTKTGERTIVSMVQSKLPFDKMEDAGMRDQLIESLSKALAEPSGIGPSFASSLNGPCPPCFLIAPETP